MGKSNGKTDGPKLSPMRVVSISIIGSAIVALVVTLLITRRPVNVPANAPRTTSFSVPAARYSKGPASAKVTLVEFGDYQCPTCARFHPVVDALLNLHPNDLKLVFYHIPLIHVHPNSIRAAIAAEAAGEAGRFWEMHDLLFVHQAEWASAPDPNPMFVEYAVRLGINAERFQLALNSDEIRAIVDADVRSAARLGVSSTPTFFVNGKAIRALPPTFQAFDDIISAAIQ